MITPVIINRLQWKAYLIFMATNFAFCPIFYYFYPETSNLSLEDIDYIFLKGGNPVQAGREAQKALKGVSTRRASILSHQDFMEAPVDKSTAAGKEKMAEVREQQVEVKETV